MLALQDGCRLQMKKGSLVAQTAFWRRGKKLLLAEAVAELFHTAAHVVHRLLCAGVEGVRFRRSIQLEQRIFLAFESFCFFGVDARTCYELEVVGHVNEQNFTVIGVDAFFHDLPLVKCGSRVEPEATFAPKMHSTYLPQ
jgi:hypothetical protein